MMSRARRRYEPARPGQARPSLAKPSQARPGRAGPDCRWARGLYEERAKIVIDNFTHTHTLGQARCLYG